MSHQAEDVEALRRHPRVAVYNGLGTGKTYTVAWWLMDLWARGVIDQTILVGPSMLFSGWRDAMTGEAWPDGLVDFVDARPPDHTLLVEALCGDGSHPAGIMPMHFTTFSGARGIVAPNRMGRAKWVQPDFPAKLAGRKVALVVDEAHMIALAQSAQGVSARHLADRCLAVAVVTATPVGRWQHLRTWGLARAVRPDVLRCRPANSIGPGPPPVVGSFDAFKARYARLQDPQEGEGRPFSLKRAYPVGVNVGMVQDEVLGPMAPYTVRRAKEDCLDLPPKVRMTRTYAPSADVRRLMHDLIDDDRAVLEDGHAVVPANVLEERLRVLELSGGWLEGRPVHTQKLELLRDTLETLEDGPLLIWASRTREVLASAMVAAGVEPEPAQTMASEACPPEAPVVATAYRKCLDLATCGRVGVIHGMTSTKGRDDVQAKWRAGELTTVVAHPGVAGAGLNWQHVITSVYYSTCLGMIARQQSEDRVHRHGLKHVAVYVDLAMEDGPDLAAARAHAQQIAAEIEVLEWLRAACAR